MLVGDSKRIKNKPYRIIQNQMLISHGYNTIKQLFKELIIVCTRNQKNKLIKHNITCITEDYRVGPLGGIKKGAQSTNSKYLFVFACDMPYLNPQVIKYMLGKKKDTDCVIPEDNMGRLQPLHAIYRRSRVLELLRNGYPKNNKTNYLAKTMTKVAIIKTCEIKKIDKDLKCFTNINTEKDLQAKTAFNQTQ